MKHVDAKRLEGFGIHYPATSTILAKDWKKNPQMALDEIEKAVRSGHAYDAQPSLITAPNVGIPAYMANLLDPRQIRILVTPMKIAQIFGEEKQGTWTTLTAQFPVVESTGQVASYNDFENSGAAGSNYNWIGRQSYAFQVVQAYGDRQVEMFGLAQINYVADQNYSAALVQMKFLNQTYAFGVNFSGSSLGLANYGGLNDPSLLAPITPGAKTAGGTTWAKGTAIEIYNDFISMFVQAQTQLPALIDRDTPITFAMSNIVEPYLSKTSDFMAKTVRELVKANFPNSKIITAPEYNTASGELVQMIIDEIDGEQTAYCAFTEKQRAGRLVPQLSSFMQKKMSGTFGTIIRRPVAIIQMLGV